MSRTFTWSPQQEAIFDWFATPHADGSNKNLVVTARAGTGKTTTICEGINRAPEQRIILTAFNKKIADELQKKLANPAGRATTLHSLGFGCVVKFWERIRVEEKRGLRADALTARVCGATAPDAIKRLVSQLHSKAREMAPHASAPGDLADIMEQFSLIPDAEWFAAGFDDVYVEKKALDAMQLAAEVKPVDTGIDFADMIYLPVRNRWLIPSADLVVVDEAQDMTLAQLEIAQGICKGRICVVGDDRQAIYSFRGADSQALARLKKELQAQELGLTITRRCPKSVVALAAELVPDFEAADEAPEGEILRIVEDKLVAMAGPGDFVLSRLNAPLVSHAMKLLRAGKRTCIAGRDVGAGLKALVRKIKGKSVPDFLSKVAAWQEREVARLKSAKKEDRIEGINDQAEMLVSLSDGAKNVDEITARIDALFTDDGLGALGMITCSSVHRSKGLEAERVFVLEHTLRDDSLEEQNIRYVAITRTKRVLIWVTP